MIGNSKSNHVGVQGTFNQAEYIIETRVAASQEHVNTHSTIMNEARLSHLPFWGPSEDFFSY